MLKRAREITIQLIKRRAATPRCSKIIARPAMIINNNHHQLFINNCQYAVSQEMSIPASNVHNESTINPEGSGICFHFLLFTFVPHFRHTRDEIIILLLLIYH